MKLTSQIIEGDCLEAMRQMPDASVDAIVTDPPYGLSFMGKKWDYDVPSVQIWAECLRVLKPGGHLLAFAGTRTQHRMAVRIEESGFEIRDLIMYCYGSGFPKSLDVSKAIDRAAGAEREKVRVAPGPQTSGTMAGASDSRPWIEKSREVGYHEVDGPIPATPAARQWKGWGTALKPALEPITVARKRLDGTVAENVLAHGTGALNIDGCRVGTETTITVRNGNSGAHGRYGKDDRVFSRENPQGRWPANLIHDGSEEVVGLFPNTKAGVAVRGKSGGKKFGSETAKPPLDDLGYGDSGSAARFFYCAKTSKADRDEGCEELALKRTTFADGTGLKNNGDGSTRNQLPSNRNHHPTVKPTALMRYLCRLVTPPGGIVLDPFAGSGSTGKAALMEGFNFIGIERDPEYAKIARARAKPPAQQSLL